MPSSTLRCRPEQAHVRPAKEEALNELIQLLFMRRAIVYYRPEDQRLHRRELVRRLRHLCPAYRTVSTPENEGPLPFALGYFRVQAGRLEVVSNVLPEATDPEVVCLVLSEYLEPGARLWFDADGGLLGWEVCVPGEVRPVSRSGGEAQE